MSNPVTFYPLTVPEIQTAQGGIKPLHRTYTCGACAKTTNGRVVCELVRASDGAKVAWCICSCTKEEPAMIIERGGEVVQQLPEAREFKVGENWPPDLAQLYDEAAKTYAAGAYTAATMVCREVLMACACHEGATDGQNFTLYVDHITAHVLTFPGLPHDWWTPS